MEEKLLEEIEPFNYAESLFLPLRLLLAKRARPDLEALRVLKPCLFFLFLFDILTVIFIIIISLSIRDVNLYKNI